MTKSLLKNTKVALRITPQKKIICRIDHKAQKIFMKGLGFSKDAGLQL